MADDHFRERKRCLEILELSPSASEEEIKKAYKAQALKYHPDKNKSPNATEHFQEIQYAYKYLVEGPSVLDHHSDSDDEGIPLFFLMKLFPWLFQSMGSRYERGGGLRPEHFFQMFHDPHDPFGYDDSSDSDEDTYTYRGHPQGGNRPAYTSSRFSSAGASAGTSASASADASSDRRRDSKRQKKRRAKEKHRAEKSAAAAASYTTTSSASSRERSTAASSDGQAESRKKDAPTSQTSLHEDRTTLNENNHDSKKNNEAERSDLGKSTEDELNLSSNADQGQSSKSEEVKPDANTEPTIPHKKTKQRMREEQRKREEEMAKIAKELEEKVRMEKERKARKQAAQEAKERQEAELRRQQEEEEIEKEAKRLALEQKRKDEEAAQKKKEEDDEKERKRLLESFEPDLYMDSTGNFLTRDTTGVGNIKRKPATFNQHPFDPWEQEQEKPSYPPEQSFQYRGGFRGGRGRGRGYFNQGSGFQPPGSFNMPNRFPAFVPESQSAYKPWADHPQQYVNRSDHFPAFRGQGHVARGGQRAVNPHDVYTAQVQQSGPSNVHANQENHVNGFERCNDNVASRSTGQQDQPERNLSGLSEDGFSSQGGGRMGYKHHTHNSFHVSENNDRGFKGRVDDSNSGRKDTFTHSQPGLSCQGERGHVPGMPATFRPTTERSSPGNANNPPLPPKPLSSSGLHISINRPLMQSGANTHPMMQSGMNTRPMMQSGVTTHPMMQSGANTHPMMQRAVSPSPPSPFSVAPPGFTPQAQNYPPPPHLFNPQQVFMPPSLRPPFISLAQPSEFTSRVKISPSTTFSPPPLFQQSTQPPLQQSTQLPLQQSTQPPLQQSAPPPLFQQHTPLSLQQSSQPPLFQQHTPPPLQQSSQPPLFQQHTPPPLQQSAPPPLFQQHTPPPLQQSTPPPLFQQHTSPPLQPSTSPPPQQSTPPPLLQQSRFSKPFNLPAHLKMNLNIPGLTLQRPTVPPFGGNTSGGTNKPETARTVSPDHGSVRAGGSKNYGLDDIDD